MTTPTPPASAPLTTPLQAPPGSLNLLPVDETAGGCCGGGACSTGL
ncbi:hypothetical protein JOD62_002418 [Microbacterium keratanolyticum]|nr:hypothetical protein [Microbacterium keratanolyticum]MBM7469870.1 hypothetical protein [Microbacterium keratanolyticum]